MSGNAALADKDGEIRQAEKAVQINQSHPLSLSLTPLVFPPLGSIYIRRLKGGKKCPCFEHVPDMMNGCVCKGKG